MKPVSVMIMLAVAAGAPMTGAAADSDLEQRFARLDTNGNGEISWAEAYGVRTAEFLDMDDDRDGAVSESEFGGRAQPFSAFDADGDGDLQLSEYVSRHHAMFSKFDTDGSGTLDMEEFAEAQAAVRGG